MDVFEWSGESTLKGAEMPVWMIWAAAFIAGGLVLLLSGILP